MKYIVPKGTLFMCAISCATFNYAAELILRRIKIMHIRTPFD